VELKNGMHLQGRSTRLFDLGLGPKRRGSRGPTNIYPIVMIDSGLTRYFVPRLQVAEVGKDELGEAAKSFPLQQRHTSQSVPIQKIARLVEVQPFDEWGRRQLTLIEAGGRERKVIQGVIKLTPHYLKLDGLNFEWESGIATTSVPPDTLDAILRKTIKADNPDHRLAVARFYLQAKMYRQAQQELTAIRETFPEMAENVEKSSLQLTQLRAAQLLNELKLRQAAGQHQLAYETALKFPAEGVSAAIRRDVRELTEEYVRSREQRELTVTLLDKLQNEIDETDKAAAVKSMVGRITQELNDSSQERLGAFLQFAEGEGLPGQEKLALALSGWVIGSPNAVTDLSEAIELFKSRELVMEYLNPETNGNQRSEILELLGSAEGIDAERIAQLLPLLPSAVETPDVKPGHSIKVQVSPEGEEPVIAYTVLLPPEYHFGRDYPMIVSLRDAGRDTEREIQWWGGSPEKPGQAQRHGYIVIAPEYADSDRFIYDYSATAHHIVLESMRDACRRFQVDSDHIFLSGHGMGGDAAFDIGMSHPDLFAGVIPISGVVARYCNFYWSNAKHLPFYVVGGQYDRDAPEQNNNVLMRMMKYGYDLIYAEFKGRGRESYYEEIHHLFDWMSRHRRTQMVEDVEALTLRDGDGRFYWFEAAGFPKTVTTVDWTTRRGRRIRPMTLAAHISQGNTLTVTCNPDHFTLWLSPKTIDFKSRLSVRHNRRPKWNDFVEPSIKTILEDFRTRGDRQLIYWARLDF